MLPVLVIFLKSIAFTRYDLAELYLKLKNYEKSDKAIKLALEQEKGTMCFTFYYILVYSRVCEVMLKLTSQLGKVVIELKRLLTLQFVHNCAGIVWFTATFFL